MCNLNRILLIICGRHAVLSEQLQHVHSRPNDSDQRPDNIQPN